MLVPRRSHDVYYAIETFPQTAHDGEFHVVTHASLRELEREWHARGHTRAPDHVFLESIPTSHWEAGVVPC